MGKTIAATLAFLIALMALGVPVDAKPHHPDVALRLSMERVGSEVRLKADLENVGGANAHNVRLKLLVPEGIWSFDSGTASCAWSGGAQDCRAQQIASGGRVTIRGTMADAPCDAFSASGSSQTPSDKNSENDKSSASVRDACGIADLSIRKAGFRILTDVTFTITVHNAGPRTSHSVVLTDPLPDVDGRWRVEGDRYDACTLVRDRLECRWSELPANDYRSVRVEATMVHLCRSVTNTATVAAADDPDTSNNEDTAHVPSLC
ncbi:MAG TPA: DUF11 domain-containing protein [Candidatus Thermoplasmatota archaeon]|nr:DUF11 domain-containing protein [Candidatus Thermoplasmatota archaeon]